MRRCTICSILALPLLVLLAGCTALGPGGAGTVVRPEPKVSLAGAKRAAEWSRARGGISLIVSHRGQVILEDYANGGQRGKPVHTRSITKNFWAMAVLMAEGEGLLDLDEPASATLTEWRSDPRKSRITLRQLLNQTAGLEPGFQAIYGSGTDKFVAVTRLGLRAEPGTSFKYGPGHYEALGAVMKRKLAARGTTPLAYLNGRVLTPLGLGDADSDWRTDRAGNAYFSAGGSVTARGLLAFGRLIEQRGTLSGTQRVSPFRLGQMSKGSAANPAYGLSLWLNANASRADAMEVDFERILENGGNFTAWDRACASTLAPADTLILIGSSGQRVYIIPSLDLIVVRQGSGNLMRDPEFLRLLLS